VRARSPSLLLFALLRVAISFGVSVGVHAVIATPALLWAWWNAEPVLDTPGDEGDEDVEAGNGGGEMAEGEDVPEPPVNVTIYEEPVVAAAAVVPSPPVPGPEPKPAAAPVPATPPPQGAPDGAQDTQTDPDATHEGAPGKPPRGKKKPCEKIDEIVSLGEDHWSVERDVIDFYAHHLKELDRIAAVNPHKNEEGKLDGFRVFLPRCTVLRQAGLQHGDIVNTINDRRVASIPQAVAAWFALRNQPDITVHLTRKNGDKLVFYYHIVR
jgi:hypothetical protein